jgi:hypothetical protein
MTRQPLTLNGVRNYWDDGLSESLGWLNGINLRHTGAFIYATGNGTDDTMNTEVNIPKLVPPAVNGSSWTYGSGLLDSWGHGITAITTENATTTTNKGKLISWPQNTGGFGNGRPYLVGLLGDAGGIDHLTMSLNGVRKNGILASADDYGSGVLRYRDAAICTNATGTTGSIIVSRWGDTVVLNFAGISSTRTGDPMLLATIPPGYCPTRNTICQLANHNSGIYYTCIVNPNGAINVYTGISPNTPVLVSNAWGGAVLCTSAVTASGRVHEPQLCTINGVQKTLYNKVDSNYNSKQTTATNMNDTTGVLFVYRIDNFVYGSAVSYGIPVSGQIEGRVIFNIPAGFRPNCEPNGICYNTGYGFQYLGQAKPPLYNARCATQIGSNGDVALWTNGATSINNNMGLSFYYECTQ